MRPLLPDACVSPSTRLAAVLSFHQYTAVTHLAESDLLLDRCNLPWLSPKIHLGEHIASLQVQPGNGDIQEPGTGTLSAAV